MDPWSQFSMSAWTTATGYRKLTVAHIASGTAFANSDPVNVSHPWPRPTVAKSVVQDQITAPGKMEQAYAMQTAAPDAVQFVLALGLDPAEILAGA